MNGCKQNQQTEDTHLHTETEQAHSHEAEDPIHEGETTDHIHEAEDEHAGHDHTAEDATNILESEDAEHDHSAEEEQHTEVDFKSLVLKPRTFHQVIKSSGEITPDKKDEIIITAKATGIIKFEDHFLFPGVQIKKNQKLFDISGENIVDNNLLVRYKQLKSTHEQALTDYNRSKKLFADKLISESEFLNYKNKYETVEAEFKNVEDNLYGDGGCVICGVKGFIKDVFVTEGEFVNIGDPLASVIIEHKMVLKAYVAPEYLKQIKNVKSANFTTTYSNKIYELNDLNGDRISVGRSAADHSFYIPIYFKMDYQEDIISGTFAEVYLIGDKIENALVIPNTAILEEFGKYYVYIELGPEEFEKQYINVGGTDGLNTLVESGLRFGQKIVYKGAYQVKLSQMTTLPAHSHSH